MVADTFSWKIHSSGDLVWGRVREGEAFQHGSVRLEDGGKLLWDGGRGGDFARG